jgi:hypothetical protein
MYARRCNSTNFALSGIGAVNLVSIVVVIITQPLSLLAPYAITYLFLLAIALVLSNHPLFLAAIPFILAFIGAASFLAPILPIIRIRVNGDLRQHQH